MDNLVQFEEDFNIRTEMWWGGVGLSQTRPIPRSPDGDKNSIDAKPEAVSVFIPMTISSLFFFFFQITLETKNICWLF